MNIYDLILSIYNFAQERKDIMYPVIAGTFAIGILDIFFNAAKGIISFVYNIRARIHDDRREDNKIQFQKDAEDNRNQAQIDADTLWKQRIEWINTVRKTYTDFVVACIQFQKTPSNNADFNKIKLDLQEKIILLKLYFCPDTNKCPSKALEDLEDNSGKNNQIVKLIDDIYNDLKNYHTKYNLYINSEQCYKRCVKCRTECIFDLEGDVVDVNISDNEFDEIAKIVNSDKAAYKYAPILSKYVDNLQKYDKYYQLNYNVHYSIPDVCFEELTADDDCTICNEIMNEYNDNIIKFINYNSELNNKINTLLDAIRCYIKVEWNRNKKHNAVD